MCVIGCDGRQFGVADRGGKKERKCAVFLKDCIDKRIVTVYHFLLNYAHKSILMAELNSINITAFQIP